MSQILPQILVGLSVAGIVYYIPRIYKEINQVKTIDEQKHSKNQMESVKPMNITPTPHKKPIEEHLHLPQTHPRKHTGIIRHHTGIFRKPNILKKYYK